MKNTLLFLLMITIASCTSKQPNIIIFFTDDQGYADVGCYGAVGYETPNIDQLASEGIRFTDFYVPATVCTPSRAGLLTGRYPVRSGLHEAVLFPFSEGGIPEEEYTMAEMLRDNGYKTICIGKWHLGHKPQYMPLNNGFDEFFGVPYSNDMDNHYYRDIDFQSPPLPLYRNEELIESGPDQDYLTKIYTEEAIRHIKERGDQPFFIYLAHNMPHYPLHASPAFKGKSGIGIFGDVIMELDWSAGEIVECLKEEGIFDNTIFIFTSDNGPAAGSAEPLRGRKAQTWEGGQREPGIIAWPGRIPAGLTSHEFITTMDLLPTLAAITGSELPENLHLDGQDVSKLLFEPAKTQLPARPFYYWSRDGEIEAVRLGDWKLHIKKTRGWNKDEQGDFPVSLYNLKEDIGEQKNLAMDNPEKVEELFTLIEGFK
ncbi:MAG: sulfatase [Bacteroidales bacterium]|nr:sulfatase [Bacteroidales bacterium]